MKTAAAEVLQMLAGTTGDAVILCGSGVSAVPPSCVPSWYGINEAVLSGLREIALDSVFVDPANRVAIASIGVDYVPLVAFSQVLHDVFAGRFWLQMLTFLDAETVGPIHRVCASLIQNRHSRGIITTNFDTLIERAGREAGFEIPVHVRHEVLDRADDHALPSLHKIHGTVDRPETMLDLLLDKRRGLGPTVSQMNASLCAGAHLIVIGFSGEDFAMGADYLGLLSAATAPARVTWMARPGHQLTQPAADFLGALAARGVSVNVVEQDLADLDSAPRCDAGSLVEHARAWLAELVIFPPIAALALEDLVRLQGDFPAAQSLRSEIRTVLRGSGVNLVQLVSAAAAFSLLGKASIGDTDGALALSDFRAANEILDLFERELDSARIVPNDRSRQELRLLRSGIRQNASVLCVKHRDFDRAERFLLDAEEKLKGVTGLELGRRRAGLAYQRALLFLQRGDMRSALAGLEDAAGLARAVGDGEAESGSVVTLATCLHFLGEVELSELLNRRATSLALTATHAKWRARAERAIEEDRVLLEAALNQTRSVSVPEPWDALVVAREARDQDRIVDAMLGIVRADAREAGGTRLGQALLSLELAEGGSTPGRLFAATVRELAQVRAGLSDRAQFVLGVTHVGIESIHHDPFIPVATVDELSQLGRSNFYFNGLFAPQSYQLGLSLVGTNAAQSAVEAHSAGDFARAERLFYLASRCLTQTGDYTSAARAELYRFDALHALDRLPEAVECLAETAEFASHHLPEMFLARKAALVAWQARHGDPAALLTEKP